MISSLYRGAAESNRIKQMGGMGKTLGQANGEGFLTSEEIKDQHHSKLKKIRCDQHFPMHDSLDHILFAWVIFNVFVVTCFLFTVLVFSVSHIFWLIYL